MNWLLFGAGLWLLLFLIFASLCLTAPLEDEL